MSAVLRIRPYRCALCHKRVWRYRGRLWLDVAVLILLGLGFWLWSQGTRVHDPDERLARVHTPAGMPPSGGGSEPARAPVRAPGVPADGRPEAREAAAPVELTASVGSYITLRDVRWLSELRQFRLIVEFEGEPLQPALYRLESPPRLVLDLPGNWRVLADQLAPRVVQSDLVEKVRFGDREEELRLVLDVRSTRNLTTRIRQDAGRLELKLNVGP